MDSRIVSRQYKVIGQKDTIHQCKCTLLVVSEFLSKILSEHTIQANINSYLCTCMLLAMTKKPMISAYESSPPYYFSHGPRLQLPLQNDE